MRRFAFAWTLIAGCSPPAPIAPVAPVTPAAPPPPALPPTAATPVVAPPVVLDPIFVANVPDGALRAVYGVYVDVDELTPDGLSKPESDRWQVARRSARQVRSDKEARARWLSPRFATTLAKHQTKCLREGYGPDPSCDADLVLCAQDFFVPVAITTTTETAKRARVGVAYGDGRTIDVQLVKGADGWKIDGVKCPWS